CDRDGLPADRGYRLHRVDELAAAGGCAWITQQDRRGMNMRFSGWIAAVCLGLSAPALAQGALPPIKGQKGFAEGVGDPARYLALDWQNFDQGVSPDGKEWGWREVSNKPDCETAAADLIAMWMAQKGSTLDARTRVFMTFHEGQVRAMGGDFKRGAEMIE